MLQVSVVFIIIAGLYADWNVNLVHRNSQYNQPTTQSK